MNYKISDDTMVVQQSSNETIEESKLHKVGTLIETSFIKEFTPVYFVSIMGTGICSNILYNYSYPADWLRICSYIAFALALLFFASTTVFFCIACYKYPAKIQQYHFNSSISVFMGCYCMGFTTIINFLSNLVVELPGGPIGIWVLWWINNVMSLYCACVIVYCSFFSKVKNEHRKEIDPSELHATLLLPIVTLMVSSSSGNLLVPHLTSKTLQVITLVFCFVLWSNAVVISFILTTIYFWKLVVYKIPPTNLVFTSFLPIGFLGQGGYGILLFGKNCYDLLAKDELTPHYLKYIDFEKVDIDQLRLVLGNIFLLTSSMASFILVSFGYFMTFIAVVSCLAKIKPFAKTTNPKFAYSGYIKFNKAFWAMTFPLGTMALANTEIERIFGEGFVFFRVVGCIYLIALIIITMICVLGAIVKGVSRVRAVLKVETIENKV